MKVVIAIDSFKGSLSSLQAGTAAATGIYRVDPKVETVVRPLADGGEGTVQALTEGLGGRLVSVSVTGPAGKQVICPYGIIDRTQTAIIEMSGAAGITQVHGDEKNPLYTTTYGVGEVICDAIRNGCHRFIIGIGGSATNDGGIGMLQALGFGLLDAEGKQVPFGAVGLESLTALTADHVLPALPYCLRCNESALRFQRLQRRFRTAEGCGCCHDQTYGHIACLLRRTLPENIPERRRGISRNGCCGRTWICFSDVSFCFTGTRHSDRTGRNPTS